MKIHILQYAMSYMMSHPIYDVTYVKFNCLQKAKDIPMLCEDAPTDCSDSMLHGWAETPQKDGSVHWRQFSERAAIPFA